MRGLGNRVMVDRSPLMQAVDAYDEARLALHGQAKDIAGMSETNKKAIAPMIKAAIEAYFDAAVRETQS